MSRVGRKRAKKFSYANYSRSRLPLADIFDPSIVVESGVSGRITALSDSIVQLIDQLNKKHSASTGATSCHTHFPLFVIVSGSSAKDFVHTFLRRDQAPSSIAVLVAVRWDGPQSPFKATSIAGEHSTLER